jgi:hypothetical protein
MPGVASPRVRAVYLLVYGLLAALGAALLARPAELWIRGLGLFAPALPWHVPAGSTAAALLALLAASSVVLAIAFALGRRLPLGLHAGFLLTVAAAAAVRSLGEAQPPDSPEPALANALDAAARALDAGYATERRYDPDVRAVQNVLDALPRPGFFLHGRPIGFTARLLHGASGPEPEPLPGDRPGTVYVGIASDGQRAWLSATTLRGKTVAMSHPTGEARGGARSAPGDDPRLPAYPGSGPRLR